MKHAREDYNSRIQDSAHLIPEDEPVFLLRGQDKCAPETLIFWAHRVQKIGASPEIVSAAMDQAARMLNWQLTHGAKIPDLATAKEKNIPQEALTSALKLHPELAAEFSRVLPESWPYIKKELGL